MMLAALVVSHWVLDVITHRPDLPLYPNGPRVGLALWNSVGGTMLVESSMYAIGLWIYARTTRPRDRAGRWGFIAFAVLLVLIYLSNALGPSPPSVTAIWIVGLAGGIILILWSQWFDRHRTERS